MSFREKLYQPEYIPAPNYSAMAAQGRNAVALFNKAADQATSIGKQLGQMGKDKNAQAAAAKKITGGRKMGGGGSRKTSSSVPVMTPAPTQEKKTIIINDQKRGTTVVKDTAQAPTLNNRLTEEVFAKKYKEDTPNNAAVAQQLAQVYAQPAQDDIQGYSTENQVNNTMQIVGEEDAPKYLDQSKDIVINAGDGYGNPSTIQSSFIENPLAAKYDAENQGYNDNGITPDQWQNQNPLGKVLTPGTTYDFAPNGQSTFGQPDIKTSRWDITDTDKFYKNNNVVDVGNNEEEKVANISLDLQTLMGEKTKITRDVSTKYKKKTGKSIPKSLLNGYTDVITQQIKNKKDELKEFQKNATKKKNSFVTAANKARAYGLYKNGMTSPDKIQGNLPDGVIMELNNLIAKPPKGLNDKKKIGKNEAQALAQNIVNGGKIPRSEFEALPSQVRDAVYALTNEKTQKNKTPKIPANIYDTYRKFAEGNNLGPRANGTATILTNAQSRFKNLSPAEIESVASKNMIRYSFTGSNDLKVGDGSYTTIGQLTSEDIKNGTDLLVKLLKEYEKAKKDTGKKKPSFKIIEDQ